MRSRQSGWPVPGLSPASFSTNHQAASLPSQAQLVSPTSPTTQSTQPVRASLPSQSQQLVSPSSQSPQPVPASPTSQSHHPVLSAAPSETALGRYTPATFMLVGKACSRPSATLQGHREPRSQDPYTTCTVYTSSPVFWQDPACSLPSPPYTTCTRPALCSDRTLPAPSRPLPTPPVHVQSCVLTGPCLLPPVPSLHHLYTSRPVFWQDPACSLPSPPYTTCTRPALCSHRTLPAPSRPLPTPPVHVPPCVLTGPCLLPPVPSLHHLYTSRPVFWQDPACSLPSPPYTTCTRPALCSDRTLPAPSRPLPTPPVHVQPCVLTGPCLLPPVPSLHHLYTSSPVFWQDPACSLPSPPYTTCTRPALCSDRTLPAPSRPLPTPPVHAPPCVLTGPCLLPPVPSLHHLYTPRPVFWQDPACSLPSLHHLYTSRPVFWQDPACSLPSPPYTTCTRPTLCSHRTLPAPSRPLPTPPVHVPPCVLTGPCLLPPVPSLHHLYTSRPVFSQEPACSLPSPPYTTCTRPTLCSHRSLPAPSPPPYTTCTRPTLCSHRSLPAPSRPLPTPPVHVPPCVLTGPCLLPPVPSLHHLYTPRPVFWQDPACSLPSPPYTTCTRPALCSHRTLPAPSRPLPTPPVHAPPCVLTGPCLLPPVPSLHHLYTSRPVFWEDPACSLPSPPYTTCTRPALCSHRTLPAPSRPLPTPPVHVPPCVLTGPCLLPPVHSPPVPTWLYICVHIIVPRLYIYLSLTLPSQATPPSIPRSRSTV